MMPSKFTGEVCLKYAEKGQINGDPPSDLQNCFLSVFNAELLHRLPNMVKHNLSMQQTFLILPTHIRFQTKNVRDLEVKNQGFPD